MGYVLDDERRAASDEYTDDTTCDTDEDGFDEELRQDVDATGADGHAQTDFSGTLCDGDVHDIHDTDTTYDERDACDAGQQGGHQVGRGVEHQAQLLLAADGEVVVLRLAHFVVASQDGVDFFRGIVGHVFREGRGENAFQIGLGQQSFHHGGIGSQYDVVLVHAHGVVAFAF